MSNRRDSIFEYICYYLEPYVSKAISKAGSLNAITKQRFDLEFSLIYIYRKKNKGFLCLLGNHTANSPTGEQIVSLFSLEMEKDELFFDELFSG